MCYPILLLLFSFCFASPATYTLQSLRVSGTQPTSSSSAGAEYYSILKLGIADLNSNPNILPNTELFFDSQVHNGMPSVAVAKTIEFSDNNITFVIGHVFSSIAVLTGVVGDVYGVAQLSNSATSSVLSDKATYPYFSRMAPPGPGQVDAIIETILYYDDLQGGGWRNIAIIATADAFGIDTAETMIAKSQDVFTIAAYQQYIEDPGSFDVELSEIVKSKARVITAFVISNWAELIAAAYEYQLVNENHVWIVPDSVTFETFQDDDTTALLSRGVLGTFQYIPNADESETVREFVDRWLSLDPEEYYGNNVPPSLYGLLSYDMVQVAGLALQAIDEMGELDVARVKPEIYTQAVRNVSYVGLSGAISFDEKGDRISEISILYYDYEQRAWVKSAIYSPTEGLIYLRDVVWFSNTTEIPDLDIRDPFHYWSCHEKELGYDSTGKAIQIQTPGSSDVDDIDSTYHCDRFIDCWNLSDESVDCSSNYLVVFIVFGIITGCLIMISILMLFLTFIFGIVLKWRRFRVSSPVFMIIVILSIIVGYGSIFAWFGKPHPVACGFQPWLLGLSSISMISALSAKTFRIWRIFRKKMSRLRISDIELLALWLAIMIPAVVILTLWTIISTPTATLKNRDGEDHYVCATGGFTGEPGGIIFFCILISYGAIVLLIGAFLSIVTRKVPSMFNESKLLAVSIYNLVLLSVVVIPVFMVIQPYNPFLAWILRTCAILYAFTAVLVLQFVPQIFSVIVFDRCKDNRVFRSQLRSVPSNTTPSTNQYSDNSSDN